MSIVQRLAARRVSTALIAVGMCWLNTRGFTRYFVLDEIVVCKHARTDFDGIGRNYAHNRVITSCARIHAYLCTRAGTIACHPGSGRPRKITTEVLQIVEAQMQRDDETTAIQLQKILVDSGHHLCLQTILNSCEKLGWTFRGSAYCQHACVCMCARPVHCMYMHFYIQAKRLN